MRAIIQRVTKASVSVDEEVVSSIGRGLCVLLGISRNDTHKDIDWMINKLLKLRVFEDDHGKRWAKGVQEKNLEILCVSQFTLTCTMKGNKPDFHTSMEPNQSSQFYEDFLERLKQTYKPELIKDGRFGAYMQVHIQNDGPVTIQLDSPIQQQSANKKQAGKQKPSQKCIQNTAANSDSEASSIGASASDLVSEVEEKLNT